MRRVLPETVRRWIGGRVYPERFPPPAGKVAFGSFRRKTPIGRRFGYNRGRPVDRYYIENFLAENSFRIRGRVLEIAENTYTLRYGGTAVDRSDVLHVQEGRPGVTIVADLTRGDNLPSDSFDCVICTQTIHLIYDGRATVRTLHRILKPGGTILATMPGISQISRQDMDAWGDCWRYTDFSARKQFEEFFGEGAVTAFAYGNVLAATAFLYCLAQDELTKKELDAFDPDYQLTVAVRATKE